MSKPVSIPFQFQTQAGPIPLSELDSDFTAVGQVINDFATYSNFLTDTSGAPNSITVTIPVGTTFSYSTGVKLEVLLANTNTATAVNINVDGLGNKAVQNIDGSVPAIGQLIAGMILQLQYNGTVFLLTGAASKSASTSIAPFTSLPAGNVTLPAPSSGVALTINGVAGQETANFVGAAAVNNSFGLNIASGTSAVDWAIAVQNQGLTANLFKVFGNGSGVLGYNGSINSMSWAADGGFLIGAPTGGSQGTGSINAAFGYYVNGTLLAAPVGVSKPVLTNRNTTTTLTADPHLTIALPTGTWSLDVLLNFATGIAGTGFKFAFTFSGTTTGGYAFSGNVAGANATAGFGNTITGQTVFASGTGTGVDWVRVVGNLLVSVAGTLTVTWAQNSSSGTNTTLSAGSWMNLVKVG